MNGDDPHGKGSGIYGHEASDCDLFFKEWKFDFTNKEIIALNQDPGFKQATRAFKEGDVEVWIKSLGCQPSQDKIK